jgi:bis(5'-nucleosyl)-tetraphosphatase (symmetrical)
MSTYAIGDLQGCLEAFNCLLEEIAFTPGQDRLLLAGDLVARGPDSLGTLRRVYDLRDHLECVLGNHDLHLLALAHGVRPNKSAKKNKDTDLQEILDAPDRAELLSWLQQRPLLHREPTFNAVISHAGIPPLWTLAEAESRAAEVNNILQSDHAQDFFNNMYGNEPRGWHDDSQGPERWRVITNYFTRMRFINLHGELELANKGEADNAPAGFFPWFEHPHRKNKDINILFGHWAALNGNVPHDNIDALDTGCVWGGALTALRLDDGKIFRCTCAD